MDGSVGSCRMKGKEQNGTCNRLGLVDLNSTSCGSRLVSVASSARCRVDCPSNLFNSPAAGELMYSVYSWKSSSGLNVC